MGSLHQFVHVEARTHARTSEQVQVQVSSLTLPPTMRSSFTTVLPLVAVLLSSASLAQAGFFDRFKQPSGVQEAAAPAPVPPSEPSPLDPFGGSAQTTTVVVAPSPGAPSVAPGQGAVKTADGGAVHTPDSSAAAAAQNAAPVNELPYDGIEYRYNALRIRPAELKFEGVALACIAGYILLSFFGKGANKAQATSWWKAHVDTLAEEFASLSQRPQTASLTVGDASTYYGHASGRRNTTGVTVKISTTPRHDIFQLVYTMGYKLYDLTWNSPSNKVTLEFELPASGSSTAVAASGSKKEAAAIDRDFIFAIVNKHAMQQLRESRWDVAALTSISEQAHLPTELAVLSEAGALTDFFLTRRQDVGIKELFASKTPEAENARHWFESLIISDLPSERPEEAVLIKEGAIPKSRKMIVTMGLPPSSRVDETKPILELALNIIDVIYGAPFPNEMLSKTKKRRQEVYGYLLEETRKEAKEKAATEAAKIKRQAEAAKLDRMTPAERRKAESKAKDKELKKMALRQQKK